MLVEEITLSGADIFIQHFQLDDIEVTDEDLDAANDIYDFRPSAANYPLPPTG